MPLLPNHEARRAGIQGKVVLDITVSADGRVTDVKVVRGVEPTLDKASLDAVSQWRFEPAKADGKPVAVRTDVDTSFSLYPAPRHSRSRSMQQP
jgi:protein TonB